MTSEFNELIEETIIRIEALENRKRSRDTSTKLSFSHAVHTLLSDLWKSIHSIPMRECKINKRAGFYSENPRYRDPLLTYRQMIAAFDGLLLLDFIEITHEGYFDREDIHCASCTASLRDLRSCQCCQEKWCSEFHCICHCGVLKYLCRFR